MGIRAKQQKACYRFNGLTESLNMEFEQEKGLLTA